MSIPVFTVSMVIVAGVFYQLGKEDDYYTGYIVGFNKGFARSEEERNNKL